MANEEYLKILKSGVEAWNAWRGEYPDVWADLNNSYLVGVKLYDANLIGAYLHGANLSDANLTNADLSRANLSNANLSGADLNDARLVDANLANANLIGAILADASLTNANLNVANLTNADLTNADLSDADLSGVNFSAAILNDASLVVADLTRANLSGADLYEANLSNANLIRAILNDASLAGVDLYRTAFADLDLRQAKGLESASHLGPSPISTSTLERSHGQIPTAFLKGCGLSDWEIEAAKLWNPDLIEDDITTTLYEISRLRGEQPIGLHRVFISYTRQDEAFVEAIEQQFDEKGVRYWRDVHDMKAGRMERQIDRAIDMNPLVLLVLSERSVKSDWVEWEARRARKLEQRFRDEGERRDVLCPVALDNAWKDCAWPGRLRDQIEEYNVLDFSHWEDDEKLAEQFGKLYAGMVANYQHGAPPRFF